MVWLYWAIVLTLSTVVCSYLIKKDRFVGYAALCCLFGALVVTANVLVKRVVFLNIGIGTFVTVTGSLIFPFTAQVVDMVNEIYGKRKAYISAFLAYLINIILVLTFVMGTYLKPLWDTATENWWLEYFAFTPRVLIVSMIAFAISQFIDINIFAALKKWFRKAEEKALPAKWLGLVSIRSFTTDVINMAFDSAIFFFLAFVGIMDTQTLIQVITGALIVKCLIAIFDTPWFTLFRVMTKDVEREF